jgi:hypothetical protein
MGPTLPEKLQLLLVERAIRAVAERIDPAPAPERVAARDRGHVTDADGSHHLVPPWRAREVAAGLRVQAARRIRPAPEDSLCCEVVAGALQLEGAWDSRREVVLGDAAARQQGVGVGEIEASTTGRTR